MTEPRLLTEDQAAAYLSIPVTEVRRLTFGRLRFGQKVRYDRRALDVKLDALSGLASQSTAPAAPGPDDDPEAAFDRFSNSVTHAAGRS